MSRTLTSCHGCRVSILGTFASLAGVTFPLGPSPIFAPHTKPQSRRLSKIAVARDQSANDHSYSQSPQTETDQQVQSSSSAPLGSQEPLSSSTGSPSSSLIPWYLQVPAPTPPTLTPATTLPSHQTLPDLPSNPPPILSPILTHLYTKIGLDHLSLLDLRSLSPPAALGPNLLMLLGTARSVKHLNTSADRFCRWLRSEYGLRPYADGLLGRQELKVKLRRRAKRMKLASAAGRMMTMSEDGPGGAADDGITTGWICVNIGEVPNESSETEGAVGLRTSDTTENAAESEEEDDDEYQNPPPPPSESTMQKYTGFGSISTNPRIVVQMFTEEKRAEMDLEGLWDARNWRRMRKEARLAERGQASENDDGEEDLKEDMNMEDQDDGGQKAVKN